MFRPPFGDGGGERGRSDLRRTLPLLGLSSEYFPGQMSLAEGEGLARLSGYASSSTSTSSSTSSSSSGSENSDEEMPQRGPESVSDALKDPSFPRNDDVDADLARDTGDARRRKANRGKRMPPTPHPLLGKRPRPEFGGKSIKPPRRRLYERKKSSLIPKERLRKLLLRCGWRRSSSNAKEELYRTTKRMGFALFDTCYELLRHERRAEDERGGASSSASKGTCGPVTSDVFEIAADILMMGTTFEPGVYDLRAQIARTTTTTTGSHGKNK